VDDKIQQQTDKQTLDAQELCLLHKDVYQSAYTVSDIWEDFKILIAFSIRVSFGIWFDLVALSVLCT
jgi:hypothetical protein